jgi:RNase P/RNase MRP subunit POP5
MTQAVKPSKREKKRYICFKVQGVIAPKKDVETAILSRIKCWIGEKNYALSRIKFLSETFKDNQGIISCTHTHCQDIKAGIMLTNEINKKKVRVEVFKVSGTIKNAKRG